MYTLGKRIIFVLVVLLLAVACGQDMSSATPIAPTDAPATPTAPTDAPATPTPPKATATATPIVLAPTATPKATTTATAVPTEPAPTAVPIEAEEIRFQSDHFELVGDLQIPGAKGKHPAIIMVHGDGGIDRYDSGKYRPIMERFLRAGYAVFSWDKPGTGESTGEFEDGAWIITDRASILVDAVEFLREHPAIDPERIGVWGISQAGVVMPMALTMTDDIAFMIVVSGPGVDSIDQTAYLIGQQLLCQGYSEEDANLAEQSYARGCRATTYQDYREAKESLIQFPYAASLSFVGREIAPEEDWSPWNREVDAFFNPIEIIKQTTIPVLAFFGEKDTQVDPFQGAQAYEAALREAGNQHYRVELVPGVDHALALAETGCMNEHRARVYAPEYLDLMEEWLALLPTLMAPGSGSGGVIAFFSNRDGNDEIYVMAIPEGTDADGSDQRNLTNHPASDIDPSWSPDGSQIAFSSNRDGDYEIYVMDADGGNIRRLTDNPAIDAGPVWSPDGSQIAFVSLRAGNCQIFLINADGGGLQRLARNSYNDWEIDWSPDGTQIAVSSQVGEHADIYTIQVQAALQGSAERQQLTDTEAHDAFPRWSPDGSQIAFISNRAGRDNWEVYVMNADGSNQMRLTDSAGIDGLPTWSPDSTQIAFESDRDGDHEIYVLNVQEALENPEGAENHRLTDNSAADRKPAWHPSATTAGTAVPPRSASLGDSWIRPADNMTVVYVPGGGFTMGSTDAEVDAALAQCRQVRDICNPGFYKYETPQHTVTLDSFWLDQTEVTNAQYRQCVEAGACQAPIRCDWGEPTYEDPTKADHPVVCVTWHEAQAYCEWVGGRLPTEAEWEYAARGQEGTLYPWGNTFDGTRLNYCDLNCTNPWGDETIDDGYAESAPVGSYSGGASWCGALDMAGNVWEWVADWVGYYPAAAQANPTGPATGQEKVLRGSSWVYDRERFRTSARDFIKPDERDSPIGFRCAIPAGQ